MSLLHRKYFRKGNRSPIKIAARSPIAHIYRGDSEIRWRIISQRKLCHYSRFRDDFQQKDTRELKIIAAAETNDRGVAITATNYPGLIAATVKIAARSVFPRSNFHYTV